MCPKPENVCIETALMPLSIAKQYRCVRQVSLLFSVSDGISVLLNDECSLFKMEKGGESAYFKAGFYFFSKLFVHLLGRKNKC